MKCPYCAGEIEPGVKKCKHCAEWLDKAAAPKKEPGVSPDIGIFIILAILIGVGFFFYMVMQP